VAKQQRVAVCTELRQFASDNETFMSRVITGDLAPCDFFLFLKIKLKLKDAGLLPLRKSRPNRREFLTI
jgi:hypothetical protein